MLIGNKIEWSSFCTLFSILIEENFDSLKQELKEKQNIINIKSNQDFLFIISRYEDPNILVDAALSPDEINLKEF